MIAGAALPRRPGPMNFGHDMPTPDYSTIDSGERVCPSCRGRTVDRYGFDCVRCAGEGTVDE